MPIRYTKTSWRETERSFVITKCGVYYSPHCTSPSEERYKQKWVGGNRSFVHQLHYSIWLNSVDSENGMKFLWLMKSHITLGKLIEADVSPKPTPTHSADTRELMISSWMEMNFCCLLSFDIHSTFKLLLKTSGDDI